MKRGVSLVEIIVATSILALILLTVLGLLTTVNRSSAKAEYRARATALAENIFEGMKNRSYSELDTSGPFDIPVDSSVWDLPNVEAQAQVTELADFDGRLKEVSLMIEWTEFGRPTNLRQTIRISSMRH